MVNKFLCNQILSSEYVPVNGKGECIFLCDFDGTISVNDVTDTLLQYFGQSGCDELEEAWNTGKIGSKECMKGQIALIDASSEEMDACLDQIQIDGQFKAFVSLMKQLNIPIHIVSDGLDYAIFRILNNHGLSGLSIFANKLVPLDERNWRLDFPYANENCKKKSGHCKCAHVSLLRQHFNQIYYVGDGSSDYCVSHMVDVVFAKDKLVDYCEAESIRHFPIEGFSDCVSYMINKPILA